MQKETTPLMTSFVDDPGEDLPSPRKRLRLDAALSVEERNKLLLIENRKLRGEVDALRKRVEQLTGDIRPSDMPIAVKKALNLAGYWNVHPNDVVIITPKLAAEFERETGICPTRRNGTSVCFPQAHRSRVIDMVVRVMPVWLPKYRRTV